MGSVLSLAARVAAGSVVLPRAAREAVPVCFRKDLLLRLMAAPYLRGTTRCGIVSLERKLIRRRT